MLPFSIIVIVRRNLSAVSPGFMKDCFYTPFISRLVVLVQPSSLLPKILSINSCITMYMKNVCLYIYLVASSLQRYYGTCKGSSVGTHGTHCRIIANTVNSYKAGNAFSVCTQKPNPA